MAYKKGFWQRVRWHWGRPRALRRAGPGQPGDEFRAWAERDTTGRYDTQKRKVVGPKVDANLIRCGQTRDVKAAQGRGYRFLQTVTRSLGRQRLDSGRSVHPSSAAAERAVPRI